MGDMPGNVAKGPVLYYLDRLSRQGDAKKKLRELLDELKFILPKIHQDSENYSLANTLQRHLFEVVEEPHLYPADLRLRATEHLARDWFGRSGGRVLWPEHAPMEPIFCQGLISAIEETEYLQRPMINSHWICAGSHYEVVVSRSFDQVSFLLLTPSLPDNAPPSGLIVPSEQKNNSKMITIMRQNGAFKPGDEIPDYGIVEEVVDDPGRAGDYTSNSGISSYKPVIDPSNILTIRMLPRTSGSYTQQTPMA